MFQTTDSHDMSSVSLQKKDVPASPFPVQLTAKAVEMAVQARDEDPETQGMALRVGVIGGGCSGLKHHLDFTNEATEDDFMDEQHGLKIYVDPFSAAHLQGTQIDYVDALSGTGFRFDNPNKSRSCGCGSSFST